MTPTTTILTTTPSTGPFVLVGSENGITVIPNPTPLSRLNYYDGKFLRADDLTAEQRYLRSLVELSNRAGGHGIAHGFEVLQRASGQLEVGPGLAIDPEGRVLLLPAAVTVGLTELIAKTRQSLKTGASPAKSAKAGFGACTAVEETPPTQVLGTGDLYVITIAHAEALCGEEDVYGKLCEEACITSTERPLRIEGIVLRARPLILSVPLPASGIGLTMTHWRSRVASAFYEEERRRVDSLISKDGLESDAWCHGAIPETGSEVPIAVVGRVGTGIRFLDLWTVRRERIDTPARRYWQWRMAMRPWDVFLAQVLQFQCQLNSALGQAPATPNPDDICLGAQALVAEANLHFQTLRAFYAETTSRLMKMPKNVRERALAETTPSKASVSKMEDFGLRLAKATEAFKVLPTNRLLINGGIVELPSAGYLPVVPGTTLTVNEQVRRLLGEGVDLRFCIVRPDYVAHALEEAQHLERISLITGIDAPNQKQEVDILVPYGQVAPDRVEQGRFYEMRLNVNLDNLLILTVAYQALSATTRKASPTAGLGTTRETLGRTGAISSTQIALIRMYLALLEKEARNPFVLEYVTGAARAETGADGTLAFHYAGSTGAFAAPIGSLGTKTPTDSLDTNKRSAAAPDAAGSIRFFSLRTEAAAEAAPVEGERAASVAVRNLELRSSISMTLELGGDPTELSAGSSVPVRAECYLLLSADKKGATGDPRAASEGLLHLAFAGELDVEDLDVRVGRSEVREAKASLSGQLTFSTLEADGEREAGSIHLTEGVTILRAEEAYGPVYKIEASEPSILQPLIALFTARRAWESATQAEVIGGIAFRSLKERDPASGAGMGIKYLSDNTRYFANPTSGYQKAIADAFAQGKLVQRQTFRAWQTIRPEVVDPVHPAHEAAIRAVRSIGTALGSARYADLAARRLFPAPTARATSLNVLATLDWVLFHRRRDKQCQIERPTPQVQTRKYALYQVALTGDLKVADLARAMTKGAAELERWRPNFVQVIEYGAGIHAVASPHTQVRASWRQDVGDDAGVIDGGIIASRGLAAAEGQRLAEDRLEALVEVVAPVTPPVLQPVYVVQTRVPDGYDVPGNDGMLVIATREPAGVCHEAYALMGNVDLMGIFGQVARESGLPAALKRFGEVLLRIQVPFEKAGGAIEAAGKEAVVKAFEKLQPRNDWIGFVASDAEIASGSRESAQILAAIGVPSREGGVEVGKEFSSATDCHGITVVRVEPPVQTMCHEVRVAINADSAIQVISRAATATSGNTFPAVVDKYSTLLGTLQFELDTATPTGTTLDAIIQAWTAAGHGGAPRFALVYYRSSDGARPLYEQQRDVLLDKMGVPERGNEGVLGTFPDGCPAITVLVPPRQVTPSAINVRAVLVPRNDNGAVMETGVTSSWTTLGFDANQRLETNLGNWDVDVVYKRHFRGGLARLTLATPDPESPEAQRRLETVARALEGIGVVVESRTTALLSGQTSRIQAFATQGTPVQELALIDFDYQT